MIHMKHYWIGDSCIGWSLGEVIDRDLSAKILRSYQAVKACKMLRDLGVVDVVPSYNALAVHLHPQRTDSPEPIIARVESLLADENENDSAREGKTVHLPVVYDGEDLPRVAKHSGLSIPEVIEAHCGGDYQVAMVGFQPHFPYLLGMDSRLETPRLDSPRECIPAGAVAIGGAQTGIYPAVSPGGWNLIGQTDPGLLTSIEPGDRIIFERKEAL